MDTINRAERSAASPISVLYLRPRLSPEPEASGGDPLETDIRREIIANVHGVAAGSINVHSAIGRILRLMELRR